MQQASRFDLRIWVIYQPNEKMNLFSSPGVYAWDRMLRFFLPIFHFRPFRSENGKLDIPGGGFHPQAFTPDYYTYLLSSHFIRTYREAVS
jgi:hypothetical protein